MSVNPTDPPAAPVTAAAAGTDARAGQPAEDARATRAPASPVEEVELWWGAYSGWTMVPSFTVCGFLTGGIVWAAWYWMPPGWVKPTALGAAGAVWLMQLARWGYRVLGYNYRLTNCHLWLAHGIRRRAVSVVGLIGVEKVTVERTWLERQLGVGRVRLVPTVGGPLVLEGVPQPREVADLIRAAVKTAHGKAEG
jgi:membrane protein YdbS with pleckstrin-like domain